MKILLYTHVKKRHQEGEPLLFPPLTAAMSFLLQWWMRGAITTIPHLTGRDDPCSSVYQLRDGSYFCNIRVKKKRLWRVKYATTALPSVWAWSHLVGRLFTQGWVQNNSLQCSPLSLYVCVSLAMSNANIHPHWHYFSFLADEVHRHCSHEAPCLFQSAVTSSRCYPGYSE